MHRPEPVKERQAFAVDHLARILWLLNDPFPNGERERGAPRKVQTELMHDRLDPRRLVQSPLLRPVFDFPYLDAASVLEEQNELV